jgi:hypothetical protein
MSPETAGSQSHTAESPETGVRIWKYTLQVVDRQIVELPHRHQVLHVDKDPSGGGKLALWAAVRPDPSQDLYKLEIVMFGTGHSLPESGDMSHLGTVLSEGFVWHVFRDHGNEPDPAAKIFGALFGGSPQEPSGKTDFRDGDAVTWTGSSDHVTPPALLGLDLGNLHGLIASKAGEGLFWVDFFPGGDPDAEEALHVQVSAEQIRHGYVDDEEGS